MRKDWLKIFFIASILALSVRAFLFENYRISSDSMVPNFIKNNWIFVNKLAYNIKIPFSNFEIVHFSNPAPGEVVLFSLPNRGSETFIKRVIAVAGDTVLIQAGQVTVNSKPFQYKTEDNTTLETNQDGKSYRLGSLDNSREFGPIIVPKDHFFVMGDNRTNSIDSRVWGPVPLSCLKGNIPFRFLR